MRFHYNTTPEETVAYLRDQAIQAKQPPAVIDALDVLRDTLELPDEIEKLEGENAALEEVADDLRVELATLVEHMTTACEILESIHAEPQEAAGFFDFDDLRNLQRYLSFAEKALERHNDKKA